MKKGTVRIRSKMFSALVCVTLLMSASAAQAGPGKDLNTVTQAAVSEAQQRISKATQRYRDIRNEALELAKAGLYVDSKKELQRRKQLIEHFLHATLKAIAAIRGFEPYVAGKVRAAKFPENAVESVRQSARSALASANLEQKIQRMRLDMDWSDAMRERYQLMRNAWGKWRADAADHAKIDSKDAEFIRKFNALGLRIYQIEKQANQISNTLSE